MSEIRKGMPDVQLTREQFVSPVSATLYRSCVRAARRRHRPHHRCGMGRLRQFPQGTAHPEGRTGLRRPGLRSLCRLDRGSRNIKDAEQRQKDPASPSRILLINGAARSEHTCPGEMSKTFRLAEIAQRSFRTRGRPRNRRPGSQPAHLRVRPQYLSLQDLRLDRDAALPLAMLLLSQPCARPGAGLDERHLSDVGCRARRDDPLPGELVSDAERAQADDRPPGLRRWRQSRSDLDARQEGGARERD